MTVTWLPLAWIVGPWELVHQHQTNSLEPEEWGPARKDLRGCARQPGTPWTRSSAPDFSAGSIHSPTSLSSVIMPGERGTEHLAPRIQADVDTRLCFSAQFIGPTSPLGEGHLLWLYFCGWSAKDPVLPWLPLPREESSENDVLLDSSMVPSLLLALNSRMENKQVGVGEHFWEWELCFRVKTKLLWKFPGTNVRWGHGNQHMYYADSQGWSREKAGWMRTNLEGLKKSLSHVRLSELLNSWC